MMYIKGVGMTKFGLSDKYSQQLAMEAIIESLKDADMKINNIDAIFVSTLEWFFSNEKQRHFASLLSSALKFRKPIIQIPAGCASSGAALWTANRMKKNFNNILVVGVEKLMTNRSEFITDEFMMAAESKWENKEGLNFPSQNALVAQEYMLRYPETTTDHLAMIAFKNHKNACLNPKAKFYCKNVTLDDIKRSPVVASPLRLMDCSISVDGATACIISNDKTDIKIAGSGLWCDYLGTFERDDNTSWDATVGSSKVAYEQAGICPKDINIAEIHDAFTIVELIAYEDLGFCPKGQAYKYIEDGYFEISGKLPVNTCGGLKAKGHPVSATGLAQIYELVKQMRDESDERQVKNVKYALAQTIGGAGATIVTHILKKV